MFDEKYVIDRARKTADCVVSLVNACLDAGGSCPRETLDMSLGEFIAHVAGPNNIRFVYEKPKENRPAENEAAVFLSRMVQEGVEGKKYVGPPPPSENRWPPGGQNW